MALLGALDRWLLFAAVLVTTGAAAFRFLVLGRAGAGAAAVREEARAMAARLGLLAAGVALVAALARLPLQLHDITDPDAPLVPQARALMLRTWWGTVWWGQLAVSALAALCYARARRGGTMAWVLAALLGVALSLTPALSGHAIGSERLPTLAVLADWVHVLAAGAWLGAMLLLARLITLPRDAGHEQVAGLLVAAFSPLALIAASTSAASGLVGAWLHLGAVAALWQTRYGSWLFRKLVGVSLMAMCGIYNWKRAGPRLRQTGDLRPIRGSILAELLVGALVLLATALLVVTPPPGEE